MPNHVHGILWIHENKIDGGAEPVNSNDLSRIRGGFVGAQRRCAPTKPTTIKQTTIPHVAPQSLGAIVRAYKSAVTYAIHAQGERREAPVWQRNYYEHIIRNENDYRRIRNYILENPCGWGIDGENTKR